MLEEDIRSADHLTNLWSDEATIHLIDQQKKHMKLTLDKTTKKAEVNKMIAKELKPWVSYHDI